MSDLLVRLTPSAIVLLVLAVRHWLGFTLDTFDVILVLIAVLSWWPVVSFEAGSVKVRFRQPRDSPQDKDE